jgi:hypothetical protein
MIQVDDLILTSVDDRLIEPPGLFAGHLDPRYQDRAPKLVRGADGSDVCTFGDAVVENPSLNAVAGPDDQVRKITHENAMRWVLLRSLCSRVEDRRDRGCPPMASRWP